MCDSPPHRRRRSEARSPGRRRRCEIMLHEVLAICWLGYMIYRFVDVAVEEPMNHLEYYTQPVPYSMLESAIDFCQHPMVRAVGFIFLALWIVRFFSWLMSSPSSETSSASINTPQPSRCRPVGLNSSTSGTAASARLLQRPRTVAAAANRISERSAAEQASTASRPTLSATRPVQGTTLSVATRRLSPASPASDVESDRRTRATSADIDYRSGGVEQLYGWNIGRDVAQRRAAGSDVTAPNEYDWRDQNISRRRTPTGTDVMPPTESDSINQVISGDVERRDGSIQQRSNTSVSDLMQQAPYSPMRDRAGATGRLHTAISESFRHSPADLEAGSDTMPRSHSDQHFSVTSEPSTDRRIPPTEGQDGLSDLGAHYLDYLDQRQYSFGSASSEDTRDGGEMQGAGSVTHDDDEENDGDEDLEEIEEVGEEEEEEEEEDDDGDHESTGSVSTASFVTSLRQLSESIKGQRPTSQNQTGGGGVNVDPQRPRESKLPVSLHAPRRPVASGRPAPPVAYELSYRGLDADRNRGINVPTTSGREESSAGAGMRHRLPVNDRVTQSDVAGRSSARGTGLNSRGRGASAAATDIRDLEDRGSVTGYDDALSRLSTRLRRPGSNESLASRSSTFTVERRPGGRGSRSGPGSGGDREGAGRGAGGGGSQTIQDVYVEAMWLDASARASRRRQSTTSWRQEMTELIESLRRQLWSQYDYAPSSRAPRLGRISQHDLREYRQLTPVTSFIKAAKPSKPPHRPPGRPGR